MLHSNFNDKKYQIWNDSSLLPEEYSKEKIDRLLSKTEKLCNDLNTALQALEEQCPILFDGEEDFYCSDTAARVRMTAHRIEEVRDSLANQQDEFKPSLASFGFVYDMAGSGHGVERWEKTVRNTRDQEVVEEVILHNNKILHRQRTIDWEIKDNGTTRQSKRIDYKDLPLTEDLLQAITGEPEYRMHL